VRRFAHRLAGERGASTVQLAGDAIRGVALGVGVTALVQSVLGGIGLAIVDIPFAGLAERADVHAVHRAGRPGAGAGAGGDLGLLGGQIGWGIFLLVCTVVITLLDNVLRPALIRMGADLPLLLIFAGVIGGLLAFGLVGIFVGPVVLAVGYMLLEHVDGRGRPAAPPPPTGRLTNAAELNRRRRSADSLSAGPSCRLARSSRAGRCRPSRPPSRRRRTP
jgi:hypothetical protein